MNYPVLTVTQVNSHVKDLLEEDLTLGGLFVRGEISNYKLYPSGHHYFSLKDEGGAIRCVLFRREAFSLKFRPQNGMKVLAFGRVSVFPRDGVYQLYVSALTADGVGDLHAAFEELKARLAAQGLFDESHKKPIPRFPARIALVTSAAGAAVRDMIRVLGFRWPMAEVYVVPCRVQGAEAPAEIAAAIRWVNRHRCADVIITGRGGGSMEDLWCFNDELVARAIYDSEIPVISAVGHEPDVTIADYVSDLRAATPSNGAELAVPDREEQQARLSQLGRRLNRAMENRLLTSRTRLERFGGSRLNRAVESRLASLRLRLDRCGANRMLRDPMSWVDDRRLLLDRSREQMARGLQGVLNARERDFARLGASLDALSPLKVLGRGYSIAVGGEGVIRSAAEVKPGDKLKLKVWDGEIGCTVEECRLTGTKSVPGASPKEETRYGR